MNLSGRKICERIETMGWVLLALVMMLMLVSIPIQPRVADAAALTAARDTSMREGSLVSVGVYTNTRVFAGGMVALNSSGYAVPAADAAGNVVIGQAMSTVDNRTNADGAGDSGTLTVVVRRGVFLWVNGDSFDDTDIGSVAYVEDDQTVQKAASASHDILAGVIVDVTDDGVWVDTYHIGSFGVGSLTTLSVSGNGSIGGTLSTTGATTLGALTTTGTTSLGGTTVGVTNNATVAGTLGVTGIATLTAAPVMSALDASKPVFTDGSKALSSSGAVGAEFMDTVTMGVATNARVGTVSITNSVAATRAFQVWVSATAGAAASTNDLVTIAATTGTVIDGGGAEDYLTLVKTHTDGTAVLEVTVGADVDRFLNVLLPSGAIVSSDLMPLAQ